MGFLDYPTQNYDKLQQQQNFTIKKNLSHEIQQNNVPTQTKRSRKQNSSFCISNIKKRENITKVLTELI